MPEVERPLCDITDGWFPWWFVGRSGLSPFLWKGHSVCMLIVQLQWWPLTQSSWHAMRTFRCENFLLSFYFIFFYPVMNVKPGARQQLEKYAGRRRPRINYRLRLSLFFFNLLQRVCSASLSAQPVFCCSHGAVALPTGLPPPAAIAKRGLKTRGEQTHTPHI